MEVGGIGTRSKLHVWGWLSSSALWRVFFFFFQAEDGIRDYKVTGVQTCALPICLQRRTDLAAAAVDHNEIGKRLLLLGEPAVAAADDFLHRAEVIVADEAFDRSGERRGGEEGRSRWAPDH